MGLAIYTHSKGGQLRNNHCRKDVTAAHVQCMFEATLPCTGTQSIGLSHDSITHCPFFSTALRMEKKVFGKNHLGYTWLSMQKNTCDTVTVAPPH